MFRRLFGFGRKHTVRKEKESLLIQNLSTPTDTINAAADTQVVPLRSPECEAALKKKKDSAELFNDAVNRLVEKLEGINTSLDLQVRQNEQLVLKMDALPQMLSALPGAVERQQEIFDEMADRMRQSAVLDAKAYTELTGIHEKITASADNDAKMSEHFGHVAQTLTKIDEDTVQQTEWIQHMNRSLSESEQTLRESLHRQQVRFYLLFGLSLVISLVTILGLGFALFLLLQK